jgi:hypothetical protein
MKLALGKILNSVEGLKKLVNETLPIKTAYRLKRIMDAVTSEGSRIEKTRIELIHKYADEQTEEQKAKKENIKITTRMDEFQKEFMALMEEEVELNCIRIPFKDIEHIKMSVAELIALEPWFEGIPEEYTTEVIVENKGE